MSDDRLHDALRSHYGAAARAAAAGRPVVTDPCGPGGEGGCCGPGPADATAAFGAGCYGSDDLGDLPAEAVAASIGCADPVALAGLARGGHVLDLGSGGGIGVLLSARRVGPTGRAYGIDVTPEMLALARANQRRAGVTNAEFLEGRI